MNSRKIMPALVLVSALVTAVYAAVYSYRYASFNVRVDYPVVWFEDPGVPGVNVTLYREGTSANITVSAARTLLLEHRSAVYYDTFDTNPFAAGRLVAQTCTWGYNATERAISINASARGPLGWAYWCVALVNPALLNVTPHVLNGSTVYVAFLFWRTIYGALITVRHDTIYLNSTEASFYAHGYRTSLRELRTGDDVYSNMSLVEGRVAKGIGEVYLGISNINEYDFIYHVSTSMNFTGWTVSHYVNETYTHMAIVPAVLRRTPYAVGVGYWVSNATNGTSFFDNFIVTVNHPPWYINVTHVPDGWRVVLKNATGHVVASATSTGGLARLVVAPQTPIDRTREPLFRNAFIFPNATLEVYDASERLFALGRFDVVLGGDRYRLSLLFEGVFEGIVLSVYSNLSAGFWSMLANATSDLVPHVNATLALVSWNGSATAENISVINGVLVRWDTSPLYVQPPPVWAEKWLVVNITARFELPMLTVYNLKLNYIFWVSNGVVVLYAVNITVLG